MKMQASDYAWVIFALVVTAALIGGWHFKNAQESLFSLDDAAAPTCETSFIPCGTPALRDSHLRLSAR